MPWQVTITWIEISDLKFLEINEIFEAYGSLLDCSCKVDFQKSHLFR